MTTSYRIGRIVLLLVFAILAVDCGVGYAQTLEQQLLQTSSVELAAQAVRLGDAKRGAIVFFQAQSSCHKCHRVDDSEAVAIGPNLAKLDKAISNESIVDSLLVPSKEIRKGFESFTVLRTDGTITTGILVARGEDHIELRDASSMDRTISIASSDIEDLKQSTNSLMPAGQVNQLASRQQFYDLVRYLIEARDGGPQAAAKLQPQMSQIALVVPEYEAHIDHSGFITSWDKDSFARGEKIYRQVCQNCHGTLTQAGSLPTSLKFAEGKFKNGSDPYSMYKTLTYGYGLMLPQSWMVPSQKYDVINYIRESFLKSRNPSQYTKVDNNYLSGLPAGNDKGPEPILNEPYKKMDYGVCLTHTYEVPSPHHNFAYKGIAVRLDKGSGGVANGNAWMVFDTDTLRTAGAWRLNSGDQQNRFIDWRSIQFNGEHNSHPKIVGSIAFSNSDGPGWMSPEGAFEDNKRVEGRDGLRYGPLPKQWARYLGRYDFQDQVVFSYEVNGTGVLESYSISEVDSAFQRTLNVKPHQSALALRVAEDLSLNEVHIVPEDSKITLVKSANGVVANIPPSEGMSRFRIVYAPSTASQAVSEEDLNLEQYTHGGAARWNQTLVTHKSTTWDNGPLAVDSLVAPEENPWMAQMRFTGLDFLSDGRIAACTWDGDVWLIRELASGELQWRRITNGLFQPLGLKVINDQIYLTCRDQLAVLRDLNGDEEIDFIECFNNDHQVTEHFHEFAMGLQTDASGNFYYAKSARHALPAIVPHHGTLLRVTLDGAKTDIVATGFRAANGVCINPDGTFFVTDQEGHWNPKNRINWVKVDDSKSPQFFGNMLAYTDQTNAADSAMEQPLCWITNEFDRSPAELLWVDSKSWGPLNGSLLNLSYGYGKIFVVPHEVVLGQIQGGMLELPLPTFPTGLIRGRFNSRDDNLYVCGMFSWAGSATYPGGLYRIRATGKAFDLVTKLEATEHGMRLRFSDPIDASSVSKDHFKVKTWSLRRTAKYGSDHVDERHLGVLDASIGADQRTIDLELEGMQPTWCMEITYHLKGADGKDIDGKIHNTVHQLGL